MFLLLKDIISDVFKPVHSSSFLSFFKGSSYTIMRYEKCSANSSLGITLEVNDLQKA